MISKNTKSTKPPRGRLITNNVRLKPNEQDTVDYFLNLSKTVELIAPSNTPKNKRPDCIIDTITWEIKNPEVNSEKSLSALFYSALKQSNNIIFDLRHLHGKDFTAINHLNKLFITTRRIRKLWIITKNQQLLQYSKK